MEQGTERRLVCLRVEHFTAEATLTAQRSDFKNGTLKRVLQRDIDVSLHVYYHLELFLKILCRGKRRYPSNSTARIFC